MTAARIHRSAKPVTGYSRVEPMAEVDADFWRLRRERAQPMQTERGGWLRRLFRRK